MQKPKISIIIPFYNRADYLKEALQSICKQSFRDYEVLIIDDGSEKENREIIESFLYHLNDERFHFLLRPQNFPSGANGSRNYGFRKSKGDFIKWFDSDDLMNKNFLEKQLEAIEKYQLDTIMANCGVYNEDFSSKKRNSWAKLVYSDEPVCNYLKEKLAWQTGAGLWKRAVLSDIKPFTHDLKNYQEYIFHLYAITAPIRIGVIEEELFRIRAHENSITRNKNLEYKRNRFKARIIALSRVINTRNQGTKILFKSIYRTLRSYGKYDFIVHSKIFVQNFKIKRGLKSRAEFVKINPDSLS